MYREIRERINYEIIKQLMESKNKKKMIPINKIVAHGGSNYLGLKKCFSYKERERERINKN